MHPKPELSLNRLAVRATTHCMTGCAIGEVLGLAVGIAAGWGNALSIFIAIMLAFVFGYSLTMLPLLRSGMAFRMAARLALVADTASITLMEIVDNLIMLLVPGAMEAGLDTILFWNSMALSLGVAWVAALPLNRWLIKRGMGHAALHSRH
ncbi:MAG: hypothetical protein CVU71_15115 [Deltaproteobacteria bacterium HGW-Deltaproteobacteria-6]|jgi:hypothetical protein|nr:MAG: hypothetical protein CVU71_15115 [Deltaproteobacteria bacterium HGW-Deltaproteobacteria-6]